MQILGLQDMYFDAVVVEVKTFLLLFRLALAILKGTAIFCCFTNNSPSCRPSTGKHMIKAEEKKSIWNWQSQHTIAEPINPRQIQKNRSLDFGFARTLYENVVTHGKAIFLFFHKFLS